MYNGILLLDKPYKWTSNFTLNKIKKIFEYTNIGYSGVLDPIATGMLPILFGNSKKFSKIISDSDKYYDVIAYLGISTDTYDSEGKIIKKKYNFYINKKNILSILNKFCGKITQYSPIYSNVKYLGKPSYKYAINNIEIIKIIRYVSVYNIEFIYLKNNFLRLKILCSKGTYIRSLINDIGNYLKCGAYVYYLRRLKILRLNNNKMISIYNIYKIFNFYKKNNNKIFNKLFNENLI